MKYLLLLVFFLLIYVFLKKKAQRAVDREKAESLTSPVAQPNEVGEAMTVCAYCGVHFPVSEAVPGQDPKRVYCSEAHARLTRSN